MEHNVRSDGTICLGIKIPYIIRNQELMDSGIWNGNYYSPQVIEKLYKNTDWSVVENTYLFLDHEDDRTSEWVGYVKNVYYKDGKIFGDLYIYDLNTALKMKFGKPKFGISPRIKARTAGNQILDGMIENCSIVINPAVKTAYINNREVIRLEEEKKLQEETEPEEQPSDGQPNGEQPSEGQPDTQPQVESLSADEIAAIREMLKKKKKYPYPEEEEMKKKKKEYPYPAEELDEELKSFAQKVKDYMKNHPGVKLPEAAKAVASGKMSDNDELSELKKKLEIAHQEIARLKEQLSVPDKLSVKGEGGVTQKYSDSVEGMADYIQKEFLEG